ncbi:MAG: hypothetical protein MUE60_12390, partial [Candidatus Eisenbacteria bacterium]|nr:hypothetical protein [Candidatus Eisenbacteria bacterium]
ALPSAAPAGPFAEEEPLSTLFGLDRTPAAPFVLLSTLLGPRPMATLAVGDTTIGVSVGDTLGGARVDSIGRRVVVLTRGGEVIRVAL